MSNKIKYEPELKEQIIRLHLEEGRTIKSLTEEYHLGKGTLRYWLTQRSKECQTNENIQQENASYAEINRLRKELAEVKKENEFCEKNHVQQSMSRAGCPYDNAPMERFYNTFKNEFYYLYSFTSDAELDQKTLEFIYGKYNHKRPHTHNGGRTPYAARYAA